MSTDVLPSPQGESLRRPMRAKVMQDFHSETDYQTIGTTKYKTHATKTKINITSAEMKDMIMN